MAHADAARTSAEDEAPTSAWVGWALPLGFVLLLLAAYAFWPAFHAFVNEAYAVLQSGRQARIERWVQQFSPWGVAAILALMLLQSLVAVIPSLLTMVVAVLSYGPVWGGLLAWGGLLLAASMAYAIGRMLSTVTIDLLVGAETRAQMQQLVARYGVWAIVTARISPALSTDAVSYGAGLMDMRYDRFVLATAGGTLPLVALVAYLGADADRLVDGLIWITVVSVLLFAGYVAYDRWQLAGGPGEEPER